MKFDIRYSIFGILLLLMFPSIGKSELRPQLICDQPVYQFGHVDQSAVITNVFTVRNAGDITFVAGMPRTTCSCTQARLNKRMIGPGETAEVTAVFTAARRAGPEHKTIYLLPADSDVPAIRFYMQGFVEPSAESH